MGTGRILACLQETKRENTECTEKERGGEACKRRPGAKGELEFAIYHGLQNGNDPYYVRTLALKSGATPCVR